MEKLHDLYLGQVSYNVHDFNLIHTCIIQDDNQWNSNPANQQMKPEHDKGHAKPEAFHQPSHNNSMVQTIMSRGLCITMSIHLNAGEITIFIVKVQSTTSVL